MKKGTYDALKIIGVEAAIIGAAALIGRAKARPPSPETAQVTGRVADQQTEFSIPFATLTVEDVPIAVDERGCYSIDKMPLGTYTVKASAPGYRATALTWEITETREYLEEIELVPFETLW